VRKRCRTKGRLGGRPKVLDQEKITIAQSLYDDGKTTVEKNFQDSWNFEGDFLQECEAESGLRIQKIGKAIEAHRIWFFRP
jgi:hypothetical protein